MNLPHVEHILSPNNHYIYLDTSAINYFNNISPIDLVSMKHYLINKNYYFCVSNVTILEILRTKDVNIADSLIDTCKILVDTDLVADPAILLVNYINWKKTGEKPSFKLFISLFKDNELNKIWRNIKKDFRKTFIITEDYYKMFDKQFSMLKYLNTTLENYPDEESCKKFTKECVGYRNCGVRMKGIGFSLIYLLLSEESDHYSNTIKNFWQKLKIPEDRREDYISENLKFLNDEGPICLSAFFYNYQITTKANRGTFYDALHITYLTYFEHFLTADNHFLEIKKVVVEKNNKEILSRIRDVDKFYCNIKPNVIKTTKKNIKQILYKN